MDPGELLFILITGIFVVVLSFALDHVWAAAVPVRPLYLFIRLPGVILHECAHIGGCFLTGARVQKVVFFSREGGSVTYTRPIFPYLGDVIISTSPLFLLPLALSVITRVFSLYLGCIFPAFPQVPGSPEVLPELLKAISGTFSENLVIRFNGWFLLYLYLTLSLVLSVAPSRKDMVNAAAGSFLLVLAGALILWSGFPAAVFFLTELVRGIGFGFMLGLGFGLVALVASIPVIFWYLYTRT